MSAIMLWLAGVSIVSVGICIVVIKILSNKLDNLKQKVEIAKALQIEAIHNLKEVMNYNEAAKQIQQDRKDITKKIKEAKTNDEVNNVIADLIRCNNDRVRNNHRNNKD